MTDDSGASSREAPSGDRDPADAPRPLAPEAFGVALGDVLPTGEASSDAALPFPVVGIGASAGGVEALRRLFRAMPAPSPMAFVIVLHLDPARESKLAEVLQTVTRMPVMQAIDGVVVEPGNVYVIPPGADMTMDGSRLRITPLADAAAKHGVFDRFLVSLAAAQKERAICIVLTGLDGDGSNGVKAIKSEGGLAMVQSPQTASHPGMPAQAIATGLVDRSLPLEQMPAQLATFVEHAALAGPLPDQYAAHGEDVESLARVLELLRQRTGLDFRRYKQGMLLRRVRRRMGLCNIKDMSGYLQHVAEHVDESTALADDLLIGVTSFFREPDIWRAFETDVLPAILAQHGADAPLRIWVPACSTGEEPYTIGMLLLEGLERAGRATKAQVFATDVDRAALDFARQGHYPDTIAKSIAPERLARFFERPPGGGYVVRRALREIVVFAPQNLMSDPPFSRLDVVSCRNLLIYLEGDLQRRLMQVFHFALNPGGFLLLGKSENIGQQQSLFQPVGGPGLRIFRSVATKGRRAADLPLAPGGSRQADGPRMPRSRALRESGYGDVARQALLDQFAPAAVLVNRQYQSLYSYGPTESFLSVPRGEPTNDLLQLVNEALRPMLRVALHGAVTEGRRTELAVIDDGAANQVLITAVPLAAREEEGLVLVTFQRVATTAPADRVAPPASGDTSLVDRLEQQVKATRRELQGAIEELEIANEELKVSNEEAMSMNEELQSTNEELETSKEELQSVNEELITVNNQLEEKVHELETTNDDLGNLLTSSHIPTLFLDRRLRIKRFTPAAKRLFSVIESDIDRPITDIASRCDTASLVEHARVVLETLAPSDHEAQTDTGEYYLRRTLPYRTRDDRIDGVVVTYVDITELRRASEGLRQFAAVLRGSPDAIVVHDLGGRIATWNQGAVAMYGYGEDEALAMGVAALVPDEARADQARLIERALAGDAIRGHAARRRTKDGRVIDVAVTLSVLHDDARRPTAIAAIERDVTEERRAAHELIEREARFRSLADSAPVMIWMTDAAGDVDFVNRHFVACTGRRADQLTGLQWRDTLHPEDAGPALAIYRDAIARQARIDASFRMRFADDSYRWTTSVGVPRLDAGGALQGYVGITVDVNEHRLAEGFLREADRRKDEFLAMLGHELRNPLVPIRNAAEMLGRLGKDDARIAWIRETLSRQTDHLRRLVDDLLDVSRIAQGTITLHREPTDLAAVLRRTVDTARDAMAGRGQTLSATLPPAQTWIDADPVRLGQMLENLLTNASKYSVDGGEVRIDATVARDVATIVVADDGIGIAPDVLPHVFDMFVQEPRALDRSQGGLGIGLALVRQLATLHGGTVEAASAGSGKGATFTLRLPTLRVERPAVPDAGTPEAEPDEGVRVLVVDDDRDAADSTAMMLGMHGYAVRTARSVEEAVAEHRAFGPDVVLMDLALPDGDGFDAARRLRAGVDGERLAVIAISGFASGDDMHRSRAEGFSAHLAKPVEPKALFDAIDDAVKRKRDADPRGRR